MTSVSSRQRNSIIGLYGIPGCGKSHLLSELQKQLGNEKYTYYEGSKVIGDVADGGLPGFKKASDRRQREYREKAIKKIGESSKDGRVTVVTGHFMFWELTESIGKIVCTKGDLATYTHIFYLDVAPEVIQGYREKDAARKRSRLPVSHIQAWQRIEKAKLRRLCHEHGIIFSLLGAHQDAASLIRSVWHHDEDSNLHLAKHNLMEALGDNFSGTTVLMLDADRTLCSQDTGKLWWRTYWQHYPSDESDGFECPLRRLFSGPLGYSYAAFRQAIFLYEEAADHQRFDDICDEVASTVDMHPEFINLLRLVSDDTCVKAVVVTSGLRLVWEKILTRECLFDKIKVLGGGRIDDMFVVSPTVKGALADYLRTTLEMKVWAFGDSPMDLGMLQNADQAFVVVGREGNRSTTMDEALRVAIAKHRFQPKQVLLPATSLPRLDTKVLPITTLDSQIFVDLLFCGSKELAFIDATDTDASRVLTTPTRDASISGPALQNAHRDAGRFLALAYLPNIVGVEDYPIPHVQGHQVTGHRLQDQHHTTIIALMRGGEPLARGIYDYLPEAAFIHAKTPDDVRHGHLQNHKTVILADWVIDSGKTVAEFVRHIRKLTPDLRIIVVAGVVQSRSIAKLSPLQALMRHGDLTVIALRKSDNQYKGTGETDTGNRLFNTMHLP
ncbi:hypothetical protein BO82DRAFT_388938 [Aspergillus uvarum CBS 121591]|uniref:Phosphoribosyltransferase domain-containing protein n=1 Tax=Aspergillus uvarum CBS 121591 TaxID=1448315 RepID=A0A319DE04_9EURO|nr:hypothetical protein BO82DRAFT_388938 [Aspergillus uvarum CBS 121591]PYH86318.1 hypothetical protein BO82DRAFT_388938 [Aspergillus uvarum CBS 121591]